MIRKNNILDNDNTVICG